MTCLFFYKGTYFGSRGKSGGKEIHSSHFRYQISHLISLDNTKEIYSEVDQLVRLFNAIKSKMKLKIGGVKNVKSEI
jgi:hypothetical protein